MKSKMNLALMVIMAAAALRAAPGIRTVMGSSSDRALPVATELGRSYTSAREMRVDLDFPSGKSAKGTLSIFFEPSTGYFFRFFQWDASDYPKGMLADATLAATWLGVSADRLLIFTHTSPLLIIRESSDKAGSIGEAESNSLAWAARHLVDIESWTKEYRTRYVDLRGLADLPGFLPLNYQSPGVPISILDIVWARGSWELTVQSQWKAKVLLEEKFNLWTFAGYTRVDEPTEKK